MGFTHFGGLRIEPQLPDAVLRQVTDGTIMVRSYQHVEETVGLDAQGNIAVIGERYTVLRPEVGPEHDSEEDATDVTHLSEVLTILQMAEAAGLLQLQQHTVSGALISMDPQANQQPIRRLVGSVTLNHLALLTPETPNLVWPNGDITTLDGEKV